MFCMIISTSADIRAPGENSCRQYRTAEKKSDTSSHAHLLCHRSTNRSSDIDKKIPIEHHPLNELILHNLMDSTMRRICQTSIPQIKIIHLWLLATHVEHWPKWQRQKILQGLLIKTPSRLPQTYATPWATVTPKDVNVTSVNLAYHLSTTTFSHQQQCYKCLAISFWSCERAA